MVGLSQGKDVRFMTFSEKLSGLRRRQGLSQEQLADRLGVTRQSVSKWESGLASPEIGKLVAISELFGVSVDFLVKDYLTGPDSAPEPSGDFSRIEAKLDELDRRSDTRWFAYTSRIRIFGLPLVSVRFGRQRYPDRNNTAVGIVAVGNFAVGVAAFGIISLGLLSVGMLAFGLLLALGMVSIGTVSVGVSALGAFSYGFTALGVKIARGVAAFSVHP